MQKVFLCNDLIKNHDLFSSFGALLNDVLTKDYSGKERFSSNVLSIDVDKYEVSLCSKEHRDKRRPTVDAVVGISDMNNKSKRFFLIELRMNYKNSFSFQPA